MVDTIAAATLSVGIPSVSVEAARTGTRTASTSASRARAGVEVVPAGDAIGRSEVDALDTASTRWRVRMRLLHGRVDVFLQVC